MKKIKRCPRCKSIMVLKKDQWFEVEFFSCPKCGFKRLVKDLDPGSNYIEKKLDKF